jgi:hypothetical protein
MGRSPAGPARRVKVPKGGGRGFRTLTLRDLIDRVVAKALNEALVPFWEKVFLGGSHGFRPGRGPLTLLAALGRAAGQGRWVLVCDDVKDAFDSVSLDLVVGHHRQHFTNNPLLAVLAEAVLRGDDQARPSDQERLAEQIELPKQRVEQVEAALRQFGDQPGPCTSCAAFVPRRAVGPWGRARSRPSSS